MAVFDRIKGALYGVAVGDALGGPLEFMPREAVHRAYPDGLRDMVGGGWLNLKPGETTDDTAMTLCVAEGIAAAETAAKDGSASDDELTHQIGERFIGWLRSDPPDVGATCRSAILRADRNLSKGLKPAQAWLRAAESLGPNQEGNGALMRCVYPGLWYPDSESAVHAARLQAHLTHSGPQSAAICAWYAMIIWMYTCGAFEPLLSDCPVAADPVSRDWSPSGYVVDTMRAVILAMQEPTFEQTLVTAVNFGGDADTAGAIAGGLAGAKYGFKAIPKRWVAALDPALHAELDKLAKLAYSNRK